MSTRPRVLGAGTFALDTVETPTDRGRDLPGGSAPYFALSARHFGDVSLVGVVGRGFPAATLREMETRGVGIAAVERAPGPVFRWHVRYDESGERSTLYANRGDAVRGAGTVPGALKDPSALFLGSTDPRIQRSVLEQAGVAGIVVLDTMAHWIRDRSSELRQLLHQVDVLLLTRSELAMLGGGGGVEAARNVGLLGPRWVVVKDGTQGATAHGHEGLVHVPAAVAVRTVDPTGAGDAFAGGVVGGLVEAGSLEPAAMAGALALGAAAGSFAVESFSFDGLARISRSDLDRRAAVALGGG